jgi:hypothetical protein
MQNAIIVAKTAPDVTMSVDSIVYFGQNGIRRNVAKTTSIYIGKSVTDRIIEVPAEGFIEVVLSLKSEGDIFDQETKSDVFFTEDSEFKTKALYLDTSQPIRVYVNDEIELSVHKHLFLDHPIEKLGLENSGCHPARVILAYIV